MNEEQEIEFKLAVDQGFTCSDCRYCQNNMKVSNVRGGYLCMREDNKQSSYYQPSWMETDSDFLCNKFELDEQSDT